jgi:hypothetical protein
VSVDICTAGGVRAIFSQRRYRARRGFARGIKIDTTDGPVRREVIEYLDRYAVFEG